MTEPIDQRSPKKERSPRYPAIDLETALTRAEQLWGREKRNYAPIPAILEAWSYGPKSSGGILAVAALKRFGLLEDRGSTKTREARLTDLARAIVTDDREDAAERQERMRQAALMPPIHREVLAKYPDGLPSDSTIRFYLVNERGFTEAGAAEFIDQFRRTLEFAGLTGQSAIVSPNDEDKEEKPLIHEVRVDAPPGIPKVQPFGSVVVPPSAPPPIQFPVYGGGTVVLQSTVPLTEEAWDQMMDVLKILKPSIVTPKFNVQLEDEGDKINDSEDDEE